MRDSVISPGSQPNATVVRLVDAAQACFEANGIQKTSIDDIANSAQVSRQTIYRYFTGKQAILEYIAAREMNAIGATIRRQIPPGSGFADKLTEALFISVEQGSQNTYVRLILNDAVMMRRCFEPTGSLYRLERRQWEAFLQSGRRAGELANDLDDDAIVRWLAMSQFMMLMAAERLADWGTNSREFIRRIIVEPITAGRVPRGAPEELKPPSLSAADGGSDISAQLARQERMLKELLARSA